MVSLASLTPREGKRPRLSWLGWEVLKSPKSLIPIFYHPKWSSDWKLIPRKPPTGREGTARRALVPPKCWCFPLWDFKDRI